ncbi:MAG: Fis family transcriptional regulator [Sideroxydans sp.]|nr:Fis family transcriptional regulator [Sideroxydans sp.]
MLEMRAIVLKIKGREAEISPLGGGGCGHCNSEGGCGSGKLTKMFCSSQPRGFIVLNQANAKVGDEVNITLPEGSLLHSSVRMYLLPLLLMFAVGFVGATFATDTASRDGYALVGSVLGLLMGFALGKFLPLANDSRAVVQSIVVSRT